MRFEKLLLFAVTVTILVMFFLVPRAFGGNTGSSIVPGTGISCTVDGTFVGRAAGAMGCYTPAGGGDVTSPGLATVGHVATFGDVAGTTLLDSGVAGNNLCLLTGDQTVAGIKTFSSAPVMSALTASLPVCTTAGKALSSTCTALIPWADIVTGNNYRLIATGAAGVPAEAAAITASKGLCSDANGIPIACASGPSATEMTYVTGLTSAAQTQLTALKTDGFGFHVVGTAADQKYYLQYAVPYAGTINTVRVIDTSGTTTLAVQVNGSAATGCSAVSVSSSNTTATCTAANTFVANDIITIELSSSSSAVDVRGTVKYTR